MARYGGEEFLLVLPETQAEGAGQVGERIRDHLSQMKLAVGKITLSIGIAEFPAHGDSAEAIIASADAAMYQAKRAGRNRIATAPRSDARTTRPRA